MDLVNSEEKFIAQAQAGGIVEDYQYYLDLALPPKRAFFCAWYKQAQSDRQPATLTELAEFLGFKNRQTLYNWRKSYWFYELGIDHARKERFLKTIPAVDKQLFSEATSQTGAVGVQVREQFYSEFRREVVSDTILQKQLATSDRDPLQAKTMPELQKEIDELEKVLGK